MKTSKRIMVVDDDHNICMLIERGLIQRGHVVFTAVDGQEAFAKFQEHPIDLAVVDAILPEMNGVNLAYEMIRRCPSLPILAMSGGNNMVSKELCLNLMEQIRVIDTIEKPFEIDDLLERVDRLLEMDPPAAPEKSSPASPPDPLECNSLIL